MDETKRDPRLGRRSVILRVAGIGAAALGTGCATAQPLGPGGMVAPMPVRTDADPYDAAGYGRGRGSGYGYAPPPRRITDSDPRDSVGHGRGYGFVPPRRTVTDSDPRDSVGHGRGYGFVPPRRSVTDSDPRDSAGRGRGWR